MSPFEAFWRMVTLSVTGSYIRYPLIFCLCGLPLLHGPANVGRIGNFLQVHYFPTSSPCVGQWYMYLSDADTIAGTFGMWIMPC